MSKHQCENPPFSGCGTKEPYKPVIWEGGIKCGGCGRERPNVEYVLKSRAQALVEALEVIMKLPGEWNDAKQIARKEIGKYRYPNIGENTIKPQ